MEYEKKDFLGLHRDYVITYEEFQLKFLQINSNIYNCHNFKYTGFLFDEVGSFGCYNCKVGFKTMHDWIQYFKIYIKILWKNREEH